MELSVINQAHTCLQKYNLSSKCVFHYIIKLNIGRLLVLCICFFNLVIWIFLFIINFLDLSKFDKIIYLENHFSLSNYCITMVIYRFLNINCHSIKSTLCGTCFNTLVAPLHLGCLHLYLQTDVICSFMLLSGFCICLLTS